MTQFKYIIIIALIAGLQNQAWSQFEKKILEKNETLENSELIEDEPIKQSCQVFPKVVVWERKEPGFVGSTIYYRSYKDKKEECSEFQPDGYFKLNSVGIVFWGVYSKFLFVKDADDLSAGTKFEIYNSETGNLVLSGTKNNEDVFKIKSVSTSQISIEFYQKFNFKCSMKNKDELKKCWKVFLSDNQVPKNILIAPPVCPEGDPEKKHQIFLRVFYPDIQKSKKEFLWRKPICELAP